jgi:hypothetical protein
MPYVACSAVANLVEADGGHWAVRGWHERVSVPDNGLPNDPAQREHACLREFRAKPLQRSFLRQSRVRFISELRLCGRDARAGFVTGGGFCPRSAICPRRA